MAARDIQEIFDEQRKNNQRIDNMTNILKITTEKLAKFAIKQGKIEQKIKSMQRDLVKEKKIVFVDWVDDCNETYYEYHIDGVIEICGYFHGYSDLSLEDQDHFSEYIDDYFYYGHPNYVDINHPDYEDSECQLAFGSGTAYIESYLEPPTPTNSDFELE